MTAKITPRPQHGDAVIEHEEEPRSHIEDDAYGMIRQVLNQRDRLLKERDRLRGALERLMLSRDASWTGGHDWEEALDEAAAALAGEEEREGDEEVNDG